MQVYEKCQKRTVKRIEDEKKEGAPGPEKDLEVEDSGEGECIIAGEDVEEEQHTIR